ncbi:MAG TPA: DUF4019 domain-containing protein [Pyrinomonadaceae bacterium]|nr:DUF4019 domain-containing protein [Pyrinomonadaceae bacterium]
MKAEGRRRKAEGGKQSGQTGSVFRLDCLLLSAFCLLLFSSCGVDERRGSLPPGAQAAIDRLTEHYAEGRFAEIYSEAADEWRAAATADQSRATLERARERLGRVVSRAAVRAAVQENGAGTTGARSVSVNYNTKFERADAHEAITLVERDGRWQLARYTVNSDALK